MASRHRSRTAWPENSARRHGFLDPLPERYSYFLVIRFVATGVPEKCAVALPDRPFLTRWY
jgi:hypothetical protein